MTPSPLTASELNTLNSFIPADFASFKAAYLADPLNSPAVQYYQYLSDEGFNYGTLALGVVRNDSLYGQIANNYSESVASANGIVFSVGSDNWLEMQYNLMSNDFSIRDNNGGNVVNGLEQITTHSNAFNTVSLPPETFTAYNYLNLSDNPDASWAGLTAAPGSIAWMLSHAEFIKSGTPNISTIQGASAFQDKAIWLGHFWLD